jgi:hypothetical protein
VTSRAPAAAAVIAVSTGQVNLKKTFSVIKKETKKKYLAAVAGGGGSGGGAVGAVGAIAISTRYVDLEKKTLLV